MIVCFDDIVDHHCWWMIVVNNIIKTNNHSPAVMVNNSTNIIKTNNHQQWWSTIPPISSKQTITSHLNSLNIKNTMTYDIGNPGLGQTQQCGGGVKLKSRLGTDTTMWGRS
jgi:hypothetical protein